MGELQVYHAIRNLSFGFGKHPTWPDDYVHIATVTGNELDDAFRLTNTIDDTGWWHNDAVRLTQAASFPMRSTSVGDIIVLDGLPWRCANFGWDPVVVEMRK